MEQLHINFYINSEEYPEVVSELKSIRGNKSQAYREILSDGLKYRRLQRENKLQTPSEINIEEIVAKVLQKLDKGFIEIPLDTPKQKPLIDSQIKERAIRNMVANSL